ncbi:MAG: DNA polymerase III subunit beta [Sporomusaceae bacterium]|jgi:DNA polymerase-3 subunit beta|nr:DNA polymerase III subunit beta [Sporomusaceae bacterium]
MKLKCAKSDLNNAVQTVQKAISNKNTVPILTGIYLSAKDGKLSLEATDYEIGISSTIDAEIEVEGNIVLAGKYFQELVKKLPGDIVEIAQNREDRTIKISSLMSEFNLLSMSAEEFPVLNRNNKQIKEGQNFIKVKDNILRELVKKTVFACATDDSNPIYTGALLENTLEDIRMVATNTHRLAIKKIRRDDPITNVDIDNYIAGNETHKLCRLIIPAKVLNELARLMVYELPVDVEIYWEKNKVSFIFENVYFESRLIEGKYPEYFKVVPEKFNTVANINVSLFYDAVERVSLMAKEGDYNVIKFAFQKDCVNITSNNPGIGKAYESVPVNLEGDELEISFNAKYIIDILKNITSDNIIFSLTTPLSAASICPDDEEEYIYIITPVRNM